jgi:flavin reductase (DIM6/NTAB) family NADH-FMN oxidoreductase RutF
MTFNIADLTTAQTQYFLQHIIAPRPICFASTVDRKGQVNLSPFSFFNMFSTDPPIVIFSPSRRLKNNTTKHTLENILEVPEVGINIVTYDIVQQVSLASCEYPKGTDEFVKAGFTKKTSGFIKPPLVEESQASLECKVNEIKPLGEKGGAGNLVIAEVICFHINNSLLTPDNKFEQDKMQLVARLGANWYVRITRDNLFQVQKPNTQLGIGIDSLPASIRNSKILTGNHLAQLANVSELPVKDAAFSDARLDALNFYLREENNKTTRIHIYVKELLDEGNIQHAWQVLLSAAANVNE